MVRIFRNKDDEFSFTRLGIFCVKAQAEAIRLIQEQLAKNPPEYLQYLSIIKWDGKLPYFFGGDVIPFIGINATAP